MKGYIRQMNFNTFSRPARPLRSRRRDAHYPYRPIIDLVLVVPSIKDKARVIVRLETPREASSAPSLVGLFKAADWQEREIFICTA